MTHIKDLAAGLNRLGPLKTIDGRDYSPAARPVLALRRPVTARQRADLGYSLGDQLIEGLALLEARNLGAHLVYRLKDLQPAEEIAFWGTLLAGLAPDRPWAAVTHAPSSGKRPPEQHLATLLGRSVAAALGRPAIDAITNPRPRHNRGSREQKLLEMHENPFTYSGPAGDLLIVDDVVFTRSTARRCAAAAQAGGARPFLLVLYRA